MSDPDAYHLHPELRGKIRPATESFFRDVDLARIDTQVAKAGFPRDWRTPCHARERDRRRFLEGRGRQDLWVFGYGSLMWDPSIEFEEVRKALCTGYNRSFCLWDDGARGSREQPGLMLAMTAGGECRGLAFRIRKDRLEHETFVLFRREMLVPVYRPVWLELETATGSIEALGFVANTDHEDIRPGLPMQQQSAMIAQASGMLGTNMEYLSDLHQHLTILGIEDPYVSALFSLTDAESRKSC